jgi:phosphoribosylaminoimidazole-succinocarboxamide synthase
MYREDSATAPSLEIDFAPDIQGKVRDIYDLGDTLLLVATDRISAFDYVLEDLIPHKGIVLTQMALFWFDLLEGIVENHLISTKIEDLPEKFQPYQDYLRGRIMLVKKVEIYPIECIVRGYLAGSGLKEYQKSKTVCGISLGQGLKNASKLDHPLFTPSTKAAIGDHDENISFEQCADIVGHAVACKLQEASLAIYEKAHEFALAKGIIIADTKFEFGTLDGKLILADEVLTPDSSRFWASEIYVEGKEQPSFDKQVVRNWLDQNWDRTTKPPRLPRSVIEKTSELYVQIYEWITDKELSNL